MNRVIPISPSEVSLEQKDLIEPFIESVNRELSTPALAAKRKTTHRGFRAFSFYMGAHAFSQASKDEIVTRFQAAGWEAEIFSGQYSQQGEDNLILTG